MKTSETIGKIAQALVKAQSEMGNVKKGETNPFFKSKFADLNSVREVCIPVLNANGMSVLQPTVFIDGKKFVETVLLHESGEFISGHTELLMAKENDPQCQGASISYGRRYGLMSILNMGAEDDDGETAMARPVTSSFKKASPVKEKEEVKAEASPKEVAEVPHQEEKPKRTGFVRKDKPVVQQDDEL